MPSCFLENPPRQSPVEEWLKGSLGQGRLTIDIVIENIIHIMGSPPNAAEDAFFLENGFDKYPGHICWKLGDFIRQHCPKDMSRIFRLWFVGDENFKKGVLEKIETCVGPYAEVSLNEWPPLFRDFIL